MYAITGITGNVGSVVARTLLERDLPVRAIVRDPGRASSWAERGCEVAVADINDTGSLTAAFSGAEGVFVLVPPNFDPEPGFPEARAIASTLKSAVEAATPGKVVYLSTIGGQATQTKLLTQNNTIEQ